MSNQVETTVLTQDSGWDNVPAWEHPGVSIEELVKMIHLRAVSETRHRSTILAKLSFCKDMWKKQEYNERLK